MGFRSSTRARTRCVRVVGLLSAAVGGLFLMSFPLAATLHLVDSSFDAAPVARLFLVDPATGDMTLEADLDASYAPYLGLAAVSATVFYMTGTDARCGAGLQGCVLLEVELAPPSTVPTILPIGTIVESGTGQMLIGVVGLTFRSNGVLYAISEESDELYVIDPATAEATQIGTTGIDLHGGDVTFDGDGRLWDWTNIGGASGLYQLDPGSAAATLIDNRPDLTFSGLTALGHTNVMYGWSPTDNSLYGVDPGSGLTGLVLPLLVEGSSYDLSRGDMDSPFCESDASCDDSEVCTTDTCRPGGCDHAPLAECCHADGDCDDGNSCTGDSCGPANGCVHQPLDGGGTASCGTGACHRTVPLCVAGTPQSCAPGSPAAEACDGLDNDCDGSVDEGLADGDADGVCDGADNCPIDANPGQQDLDEDGTGDPCDFGIVDPVVDEILDCRPGAPRPSIVWTAGTYDRYRVELSWMADFSSKITSGTTLLSAHSWTPGVKKWIKVCAKTGDGLHIRIFGVDKNLPKGDPARKVYSPAVSAGVLH